MKKLKCEDCGGHLTVEENGEFAKCEFCDTRYKLNDDKTVIVKIEDDAKKVTPLTPEQQAHFDKTMNISSFIIIFVVLVLFAGIGFVAVSQVGKENTKMFNRPYENQVGKNSGFFIESMLSDVITNNKTNKKHQITVIYKDYKSADPEVIEEIKNLTDSSFKNYEVSLDYDNKGYVNTIIIKDKD